MRLTRCDFTLALAPFRRRWGTAASAVALLALAVALTAANASVFLFLHARPLAYPNGERVVVLGQLEKHQRHATLADNLTLDNYLFVSGHLTGFERIAGAASWRTETLRAADRTEVVSGAWVTPGYFEVLGLRAALGTTFSDPAAIRVSPRPVLLSDQLWTRWFGRDPSLLSSTVWLNDRPHVVVGIMPAGMRLPGYATDEQPEYWAPLNPDDVPKPQWQSRWYPTIGLRRSDVSLDQIRSELAVATARLKQDFPELMAERWLVALDLKEWVVGTNRRYVNLLLVTTGLLSALILINLINLLVAQLADRATYFHTAAALGANRRQVMRPLTLEHVIMWLAATALAVPIGLAYQRLLQQALGPAGLVLPRFDRPAFAATALVILIVVLVTLHLSTRLLSGRKRGAAGFGRVIGARSRGWIDGVAIFAQAGLAVVLLVLGTLLAQSIGKEASANRDLPLVRSQHAYLVLREGKYETSEQRLRVFLAAREAVRAVPGVEQVGLSYYTHPSERTGYYQMIDDLDTVPILESPKRVIRSSACPDYFATAGLGVVAGRGFTPADVQQNRRLMVVSQRAAELFWPNADPIGRRVLVKHRSDDWAEVIGVVQDIAAQRSEHALPLVWRLVSNHVSSTTDMLIRTHTGAPLARDVLQRALATVDPEIGIATYEPVETFLRRQRWLAEAMAQLSTLLAAVAAGVCAFGVFSILNRRVSASLPELALRKALGAQVHHVIGRIARQDAGWILGGILAGGLISMVAAGRLFETGNLHAAEIALAPLLGVGGVLGGAVLGAALPARRAVSANLVTLLRESS